MTSPTRQQIQTALDFELRAEQDGLNYDEITSLALIYRQFIEYYDLANSPMKHYFIERMKRLMQSPSTMQSLILSAPSSRRNSPQDHQQHYYQNYQYETLKNQTITPRGIKQLQNDFQQQKENIQKIINNDYAKQLQQVTDKLQLRKQRKQKSPGRTFTKIYKQPTLDLIS